MNEFLHNLEKALADKVFVTEPTAQAFFRNGDLIEASPPLKQYALALPDSVTEGPAPILIDYSSKAEFNIDHIGKFVNLISNWSKKIAFCYLIIPKGVEVAQLHRHNNIIGRYMEDYVPYTDNIMKRWDFLVQKLD